MDRAKKSTDILGEGAVINIIMGLNLLATAIYILNLIYAVN